jgi:transposase
MLGLAGFVVLAGAEYGGELEVLIETTETTTGCPRCGVVATAHGRREHLVRDIPSAGRPVTLVWAKRLWRCREPRCQQRTWTETSPAIRAKAALTERARVWACRRVGEDGATVEDVRLELGVGWGTVMRAVREYGRPRVEDPDRLAGVVGLGVDESAFLRATAVRSTQFVTGVVDLTPGRPARLLDVVPGRSGTVYAAWIADREQAWRDAITFAALDPFRGYATALRTELPAAVRVLDAFHVVRLGFQALDEVRRRVQQETLGHRGYRADPLYGVRRALRRGEEKLTDRAWARIEAALAAGDPDGEVAAAWWCAQRLRGVYLAADPEEGRRRGAEVIELTLSCPVPEVARLGRTLRSWRSEFLAYFATGRASNGPTEAMNLLIEKIRRIGHGFRNIDNYRLRLLLYCGVDWQTAPTPRIRRRRPRMVA